MGDWVLKLTADTRPLSSQCRELALLCFEAGDIPESVLQDLRGLTEKLGDELVFGESSAAAGAGEQVVTVRFREGGEFDRIATALRALGDRNDVGH